MLTKIREKAQGIFAWVILLLICVPFALWGIQNYLSVGKEASVAKVGDKEFFQRDVNRAYQQYSQQMARFNLPEQTLKSQALEKLIRDEVLLQYVQDAGLVVTDDTVRQFIKSLQYFQNEGQFDKKQYKALLASQGMTPAQFVQRIRKAIIMEQFQRSVTDSSFATQYDIDSFFKLQNQQRSIEYISVPLPKLTTKPTDEELSNYYQQHQEDYKTPEQVKVQYIELSLQKLADAIEPAEAQLKAYYEEQKDLYTTKERRKISHILFAFNADTKQDKNALERALKARERLKTEDFATLAKTLSDDKLTAKKGGDLGLFTVGVMEKSFEEAATKLQLNEVSEPVKSAFGYHLIKVTELVPATVKSFEEVKDEVRKAYQRSEAESTFYDLGEKLAESSYENSDSLDATADILDLKIKQSDFFTREKGQNIASELAVRAAAFTEEVLKGNNSEPIELGPERVVVLHLLEHRPAAIKPLQDVKTSVAAAFLADQAKQQAVALAQQIKAQAIKGKSFKDLASVHKLELKSYPELGRNNGDLPWQLNQAVFKAAKPVAGKPTIIIVGLPSGEQVVLKLLAVKEGKIAAADTAKQQELAKSNIAKAYGQAAFNAVVNSLRSKADIQINKPAGK